jgi:hypothetical protein
MRAVWSFWTKPFRLHHRSVWPSERHHLLAWVLSVETARRHYPDTMLCTDDDGARLLVDRLGLEFAHVSTALNALAGHDPGWWALGKIYAYRAQTGPFVHLDNDVFLWQPLPERLFSALVFAQNPEYFTTGASYYQPEEFERSLHTTRRGWLPAEWVWYRSLGPHQRAVCCGIFGGRRLDFIHHYAEQAIRLLEHPDNQHGWALLADKIGHNILFEQYLLSACLEYHRQQAHSLYRDMEMQYLFNSPDEAFDPGQAARAGYTHLIAGAKQNRAIAERLERRVRRDYPGHYERCVESAVVAADSV